MNDKEFTDEQIDILQDHYFGNYASHNEDEDGCSRWLEDLDYDEGVEIIARIERKAKRETEILEREAKAFERGRLFGRDELKKEITKWGDTEKYDTLEYILSKLNNDLETLNK